MTQKIQFKRGQQNELPTLAIGEPAFTLDTKKMFVGSSGGNIELAKSSVVHNISYVVDLDRWGITQGSFGKPPYTTDEWAVAYNNIQGLNAALVFAKDNGYNRVILPKGTYSFCYTNPTGGPRPVDMKSIPIQLFSNQTLDLNGSTFEVMYDSINKNPYDLSPDTTEPWRLSGNLISLDECINSHVTNGKIIGDIPNRSFSDAGTGFESEKGMEQTRGIGINNGAKNCSVSFIDISMFMGDAIRIGNTPTQTTNWNVSGWGNNTCNPGYINNDGTINASTSGAYLSPEYTIIQGEHKVIQLRTNGGYTRIPAIKGFFFEFVFLDSSKVVVARKKATYLQSVTVPYNAAYLRMQFTGQDVGLTTFKPDYAITKVQAANIHIHHCDIHDNHRGGISGGADDTLIEWNRIYHNGLDSSIGVPLFPDTTRYCINFEDSYCNKVTIRNNLMFSGFNGLLLSVYNINVTGNIMYNFSSGVLIYNNARTVVRDNLFIDAASIGLMDNVGFQRREIDFEHNWVLGGSMSVDTTSYPSTSVQIRNNRLTPDSISLTGAVLFTGNKLDSTTGDKNTATQWTIRATRCTNNDFNNCAVQIDKYDDSSVFSDNRFNSVVIRPSKWTNEIDWRRTRFYNSFIDWLYFYDKTKNVTTTFTDCTFQDTTFDTGHGFINDATNGNLTVSVRFKRCEFNMTNAIASTVMITLNDNVASSSYPAGVAQRQYKAVFKDCEFNNTSDSPVRYIASTSNSGSQPKNMLLERCSIDTARFKLFGDYANNSATMRDTDFLNGSTPITMTNAAVTTVKQVESSWNGSTWI
jgi:hypothetical protein